MKKISQLCCLLLTAVMLLNIFPGSVMAQSQTDTTTITILHTNDTHGRYAYKENKIVGFDKLASLAKTKQADLILDAGDTWHGQSFATVEQGKSTAELLKSVGYTAMTPGNHDFNYGKDAMKPLASIAGTPLLSCNVIDDATGEPYFTPSVTVTVQTDIKVGIIGVTSPDIYSDTAPKNVEGLTFAEPTPYVQKEIDKLKGEGCTVIIALAHMGDSALRSWTSERLVSETTGIDVVVDGHTHDIENQLVSWNDGSGQGLCVQTGSYFENVGMLTLTYDKTAGKIVNLSTENERLFTAREAAALDSDAAVSAEITKIETRQQAILEKVVGYSDEPVNYTDADTFWGDVRIGQQPIGNVIADAYVAETGADIAFENAGGIRGMGLPQGNITYNDIISLAPFGNYVVTKAVSGQTILNMLETNLTLGMANKEAYDTISAGGLAEFPENSGAFLQWSGVEVVYDLSKADGSRVVSVNVGGQPLDREKTYIVATNNFAAISSDYPEVAQADEINQYGACDEILCAYIGNKNTDDWTVSIGKEYFTEWREIPVTPTVPVSPVDPETSVTDATETENANVKTGIATHEVPVFAVMLVVVTAMAAACVLKKRQV